MDFRKELANKYAGAPVLLDGETAKVVGRNLPFAQVVSLVSAKSAEYAWQTIDFVIRSNGGHFKTN